MAADINSSPWIVALDYGDIIYVYLYKLFL